MDEVEIPVEWKREEPILKFRNHVAPDSGKPSDGVSRNP
jgi:hypothetical protein